MKMLDLIRQKAAPEAVLRAAAKGSLSVPPDQMIEILVYLSSHSDFGPEARSTLAHWNEKYIVEVLSNSAASREVLDYFWAESSCHSQFLPALMQNPSIPEAQLMSLATVGSREILDIMLTSPRVRGSATVLKAMESNPNFIPSDLHEISSPEIELTLELDRLDPETESAHSAWKKEHSAEITAEEGSAFQLTDADDTEKRSMVFAAPATDAEKFATDMRALPLPPEQRKLSALQKIARMTVAERIKTAFGGDKEERSILIRDTSRVVQNAVLASPRLSDAEIETFAASKTVQENVFREMARNRKFIKNYSVIKNLVNNPRCPLDLSLTLIKNLLVNDLYQLQFNKNIPDTIRKVAFKLHVDKKQASQK